MATKEHLRIIKQGVGVWNQWRREHADVIPDLSGAYLIGKNLNLANLSGANFSGAYLCGAYLIGANLKGARLRNANLDSVVFRSADLRNANLNLADLRNADLSLARLDGGNLNKALIGSTIFGDIDLSLIRGLDTVRHWNSSIISINTLYLSNGKIPEVFLRGAGVPEGFIKHIPDLNIQPPQFYPCFISYSHKDQSFAQRLYDCLQSRGIRCWLDEHDAVAGRPIQDEIDRGFKETKKVLLCCSESSLTSWWVDHEIDKAITTERQLHKDQSKDTLVLIPLNLDGYMFSKEWQSSWADKIRERIAPDFTKWEHDNTKFEAQFERVVQALKTQ